MQHQEDKDYPNNDPHNVSVCSDRPKPTGEPVCKCLREPTHPKEVWDGCPVHGDPIRENDPSESYLELLIRLGLYK